MKREKHFPSSMERSIWLATVLGTGLLVLLSLGVARAEPPARDDAVTLALEASGAYTMDKGDSKSLARAVASFRALVKAAGQAADRYEAQKLIQFKDRDKQELIYLVADMLAPDLLGEQYRTDGGKPCCTVRIRTTVRLSDFIRAQLQSLELSVSEAREEYRQEMEPHIPTLDNPGQALAKVRRLIGKKELRMAIIYLDRMQQKYPDWWEIYEARAEVMRLENRPARMLEALRKACELGSPTACDELRQD